jgi:hypothetical protein
MEVVLPTLLVVKTVILVPCSPLYCYKWNVLPYVLRFFGEVLEIYFAQLPSSGFLLIKKQDKKKEKTKA